MFKLLLLLISVQVALSAPHEERIVGGSEAKDGEFPYMVSVRKYNQHYCGGSILNNKFVLTAAHCVYRDNNNALIFTIQYGSVDKRSNKTIVQVDWIYMHEDYWNDVNLKNDVAILELQSEIEFGPNAQPIKLPTPFETPEDNVHAVLVGWGLTASDGIYPDILQKVDITLFTPEYCANKEKYFDENVHVCAGIVGGGKGQCSADSGGPLAVDGKQFGVVSWSIKPCAGAEHPGVFAKVTNYRDWIRKIAGV